MNKVLITGANGLLATNVIEELLKKGYWVRGLLRDCRKYKGPRHQKLELNEGDITDENSIIKALNGCEYLIHVAALTAHDISSYAPYLKVNVEATERLLKAAISAKIKKFVYVSSANAFGFGNQEHPGNENTPIKPPFSESHYAKSKLEGQKRVLKYKNQIDAMVVNPTFMIGPYDSKPSSGKIIIMGYNKKLVFCPPGGKNFVNVTDVSKGTVSALKKGKSGQAYLMAGENLTYKQFFQKLSAHSKKTPFIIKVPCPVLLSAGVIGNIMRWFGLKTQLSLTNMKMLCVKNFYSNQKAKNDLGVNFEPVESGIEAAVKWFKETGIIS
ncbi:NAD-dependent epimerase/dehydratase family protein [Marinilabilia rubra]|uniref:NAD-dependent dehydratase n=1 Tax=Marinilabilia rubra TaxID=2162893 RepID=A0A2U2BAQ1_9BACT|nr:NAD-dependent epimerase/dehydratase family protein [Marinilabilia rubra]PWE00139.1 NAD-dependent dehydratase [Marinilabilia rubra]